MYGIETDKLKEKLLDREGGSYWTYVKENKLIFIISGLLLMSNIYFLLTIQSRFSEEAVSFDITENVDSENVVDENMWYVDVSGAVEEPGVYSFEQAPLLKEAISKAGGFSEDADLKSISKGLNLAVRVGKNQKIYIPFLWEELGNETDGIKLISFNFIDNENTLSADTIGIEQTQEDIPANKSSGYTNPIEQINSMSKNELLEINGIGEVYAGKIISARPFSNKDDLYDRSGIPPATLDKMLNSITAQI